MFVLKKTVLTSQTEVVCAEVISVFKITTSIFCTLKLKLSNRL